MMKILHAPLNIGGIGGYLSEYQRGKGYRSDFLVFKDNNPYFNNHNICLGLDKKNRKFKSAYLFVNFVQCLFQYDLFHFYFGKSLLPNNIDLPILKMMGKKVLMTCCGSDVRIMGIEYARNPYACRIKTGLNTQCNDQNKINNLKYISRYVDVFFAPRNLYDFVASVVEKEKINSSLWLHNVSYSSITTKDVESVESRDVPVIIHMPSNTEVKGTRFINTAIDKIRQKGLKFEYKLITGLSHEDALKSIKDSDIVIDQMLLGGIGSTAIEGMRFGKVVVSYILENVKEKHYPECPVFNANIDNLEQKLQEIIEDVSLRIELGKKGIQFVKDNVNVDSINDELIEIYRNLYTKY